MNLLVSAGPTREPIDAVRFLSNRSSGRTGYAVAEVAALRGHEVALVSGPVALEPPAGVELARVETALELRAALLERFPACDALIMTAAVADYRPKRRHAGKLKKTAGDLRLDLERNPDILEELGKLKDDRILIGFALEVDDALANARSKLRRKNLDLLVLNGPENLASQDAVFRLVTERSVEEYPRMTKRALAELLVSRAEELVRR